MNKIESLESLKQTIEKEDTILAYHKYSKEGCNCVIGHLLKQGGLTEEQLKILDDSPSQYNFCSIGNIFTQIAANEIEKESDFVGPVLINLGFDPSSDSDKHLLDDLQYINDDTFGNKDSILKVLSERIDKLKAAN